MKYNLFPALLKDQRGASVMEFGLIALPLSIMLMGVMDAGHGYYVDTVLDGAMEQAGRSSSLEGATSVTQQNLIDTKIRNAIRVVAPNATVTVTRRFYKTFSQAQAAQAETIVQDVAPIGQCDATESYIDTNNNNNWDADGGDSGQGGAKDIVIIKVAVSFPRLFPTASLIGLGENVQLLSDSILANQPYAAQTSIGAATTRPCVAT